jgi:hypothetical protein
MIFNYKWTTKEEGNYAIRKREAKGQPAGKEIEPKSKQTSATHFFIWVDKDDFDTIRSIRKINEILKTITYEYVYRGKTEKKSSTKYLTKKDIEAVLENVEAYKGKKIKIKTADSKIIQRGNERFWNAAVKEKKESMGKRFGEQKFEKALKLLQGSVEKENEIKKETREAEKEIKKLNGEIKTIRNNLTEKEAKAKTEKEKIEVDVFCVLYGDKNKNDNSKEKEEYARRLELYYKLAKAELQKQAQNKRQERYRKNKKAENHQ